MITFDCSHTTHKEESPSYLSNSASEIFLATYAKIMLKISDKMQQNEVVVVEYTLGGD